MRVSTHDILVIRQVEFVGFSGTAMADLFLDTGAALTRVSSSILEVAGFDSSIRKKQQRIVTGKGVITVPVVVVPEVRVGELVVKDLAVCIHDIPEAAHVEGLLGLNFFKHFRTVIDYRAGYLDMTA